MGTETITVSTRGTESLEARSSIALSVCQHHASSVSPRRLCTSRHRRPRRSNSTSLLDVQVASFMHPFDGQAAPGLILMSGELSANTLDVAVQSALLEFAAFAHSVVLDLSHVDLVDERGSEMVEALYRVVRGTDGQLSLHNPNCVVEHVLRFCGVSDRIVVCHPE